jgi:hypothetical protein
VTPGITTWEELGRLSGRVLAILNSPVEDQPTAAALFDELQGPAGACDLHVIAGPEWRQWLKARNVPDDHLLFSVDATGTSLELNHFLESPAAMVWAAQRRFDAAVGSAAHALYNDEVKEIFERRLPLLVGAGRYLAHTLPNRYVFVLDLPALLIRFSRLQKLEEYDRRCRALVEDLHRVWSALGRRAVADEPAASGVFQVLGRHLPPDVFAFDEESLTPLAQPDLSRAFADLVLYLRSVLCEHAERLAEREAAVDVRDTIIENLRREQETLPQRWRRKLRGGR